MKPSTTYFDPNCDMSTSCGTPGPGAAGGPVYGPDGSPVESLKWIGSTTGHTTFPSPTATSNPDASFDSYGYAGSGGVPAYDPSPYYGLVNPRLLDCAAGEVISLAFATASPVNWAQTNAASLPAGAAALIGVAAGASTTVAEFLGVAILAMGPAEFLLMLGALGLAAYDVFKIFRCATT